jgi:hypothetical protein
MLTPWTSDQGDWLARYSISFLIIGPSPRMELVLSWMIRYVEPALSSCGGAIGEGGTVGRRQGRRLWVYLNVIIASIHCSRISSIHYVTFEDYVCRKWLNCIPLYLKVLYTIANQSYYNMLISFIHPFTLNRRAFTLNRPPFTTSITLIFFLHLYLTR